MPGRSQQTQPEDSSLPQYDLKPIVKNGDDKVHIYLCAKPFQEEMGISFKKGGQIPGASSKKKQDLSDVILARELVNDVDKLFAPRRQDQAGMGLANLELSSGKDAR